MIRYITGTVLSTTDKDLVIETNGLGYLVTTSQPTAISPGDTIALHTHLAVRETALDLYGFIHQAELELFELLLTIPKIGPKSAMQIMHQADSTIIHEAVALQDAAHLSKLSGIGKKTAEKIVIALQDKLPALPQATPSTRSTTYQDAFDTLITLGYEPGSVRTTLDALETADSSTSSLVKDALQKL